MYCVIRWIVIYPVDSAMHPLNNRVLVEFWVFLLLLLFYLFTSCFFASITFGDLFFLIQDNKESLKHASGHTNKNTIFHAGQYPFKSCSQKKISKKETEIVKGELCDVTSKTGF